MSEDDQNERDALVSAPPRAISRPYSLPSVRHASQIHLTTLLVPCFSPLSCVPKSCNPNPERKAG